MISKSRWVEGKTDQVTNRPGALWGMRLKSGLRVCRQAPGGQA